MANYKAAVIATMQFEGIHHWPECPIDKVFYLKDLHRHMFHVKVVKSVNHDDRDTEIICLKHDVNSALKDYSFNKQAEDKWEHKGEYGYYLGRTSCETLARYLCETLDLISAEVLEDGENGAIIYKD